MKKNVLFYAKCHYLTDITFHCPLVHSCIHQDWCLKKLYSPSQGLVQDCSENMVIGSASEPRVVLNGAFWHKYHGYFRLNKRSLELLRCIVCLVFRWRFGIINKNYSWETKGIRKYCQIMCCKHDREFSTAKITVRWTSINFENVFRFLAKYRLCMVTMVFW